MPTLKAILDTTGTLFVIVAASALLWRLFQPTPTTPGQPQRIEEVSNLSIAAQDVGHARGTGPLALIEFSDFECPFCAQHARTTGPSIEEDLLASGQIRQIFFHFPLPIHASAQKAAEAAECAAKQERFWEMHASLFAAPDALAIADLTQRAERLGLDVPAFVQCLEDGEVAAVVREDADQGRRLAVNATPTFFVGIVRDDGSIDLVRRINGVLPYRDLSDVLEEAASEVAANDI